jgi:hypothetical protein
VDTVIPGHIPVATINELKEYASFTRDFVNFARASLKAGKSVELAAKEYTVDPKYKGYVATIDPNFLSVAGNLQIAYTELKGK